MLFIFKHFTNLSLVLVFNSHFGHPCELKKVESHLRWLFIECKVCVSGGGGGGQVPKFRIHWLPLR